MPTSLASQYPELAAQNQRRTSGGYTYLQGGSGASLGGGGGTRPYNPANVGTGALERPRDRFAPPPEPAKGPSSMEFFKVGGLPGGAGAGVPAAQRPNAPALTPPREIGANIPELERMGAGYETHLRNLEAGTGYAMDVLGGQQRDQLEAQVAMARQAAEQQGIPFNEAAVRSELQRGVNAAMAQEKLGREQLLTGAYGQAPEIVGANELARQGRWKTGQAGDIASMAAANQQYGIQAGMYGNELDAANQANNALLNFLSNLYGGMFSAMGSMSTSTRYG